MLKTFAIFLSSLILLQSLDIGLEDISKINVLLEHAQFHQEKYGDSFIDFLTEHYGSSEHASDQHKEHKNLPFKKDGLTHTHLPSVFTLNAQIFELKKSVIVQTQQNYFYKDSFSFFEKPSVFQPPKYS
ncbi:hypothetical protein K8354_13580 [Polaribacter litorisediminis]|uniref:hypothetical protein n=1 Tax=Polaribacter litorisediminis TaxID=1908341 RepID=UPI001CC16EF8|nr:hypothetical protein [Polaribacter litorisediminis]UAM97343.1 hypothetical protein K8354_13580 [Polaribacter litorisediminis]